MPLLNSHTDCEYLLLPWSLLVRQGFTARLRKKRSRSDPKYIDHAEDDSGLPITPEISDQRSRDERTQERHEPRRVKAKTDRGPSDSSRVYFREPRRAPRVLAKRESRVNAAHDQEQRQV